jgi:hypothetical protein
MTQEKANMLGLISNDNPIDFLDASEAVAATILADFRRWQAVLTKWDKQCVATHGQNKTEACPFFGGLLLALCNTLMPVDNRDAVQEAADQLGARIRPRDPTPGELRRVLNQLFDAMGILDDTHILNFIQRGNR